jgi:FKBP-type peptidyl-prolyl cis-trans isomerase SlyD
MFFIFLGGKIMQKIIQSCTVVTLSYRLSDPENSEQLDYDTRLFYLHGGFGEMFVPAEQSLAGKSIGEKIDIIMEPKDAFGVYDETLILQESRAKLAKQCGIAPEDIFVGLIFAFTHIKQKTVDAPLATVTKIDGDEITLDANHSLSGRRVRFEAEVLDVRNATEEELAQGRSIDNS